MSMRQAASSSGAVRLSLAGPIAHIVFDRPEARNAMTWTMYEDLRRICGDISAAPEIRVAVLRGAGGAFIAGTDIEQFKSFNGAEDGLRYEAFIDAHVGALEQLSIPTIAVIDGWAVGGGLAIAAACDFRIADERAQFGVPISRTVGNCLSMSNVARLVAHLGDARVRRMLLLAEMLTTDELVACGFIRLACGPEALDGLAHSLAQTLLERAPLTIRASKRMLNALHQSALPSCDELVALCYGSQDFAEGVSAFVDKRSPRWGGR